MLWLMTSFSIASCFSIQTCFLPWILDPRCMIQLCPPVGLSWNHLHRGRSESNVITLCGVKWQFLCHNIWDTYENALFGVPFSLTKLVLFMRRDRVRMAQQIFLFTLKTCLPWSPGSSQVQGGGRASWPDNNQGPWGQMCQDRNPSSVLY